MSYMKKFRERLKKEDPALLREIDRLKMQKYREQHGDKWRAYFTSYMKRYRKEVQGMIPYEERNSKEYIQKKLNEHQEKLNQRKCLVPKKELTKDKEYNRLYSRVAYWKNKLKGLKENTENER